MAIAPLWGMSSRVKSLAKPRTPRTPPSAFRPVAVSEVEVDIVEEVFEPLPRFASIPDYVPSPAPPARAAFVRAPAPQTFGESDFEATLLRGSGRRGASVERDNSFDMTVRKADSSKKAERMASAQKERLFDAPFAHRVATTPPSTFAARPVVPLARARQNVVPPAAPSSTGTSLSPVYFPEDESGMHQARVGAPTVLVPRASLSNESSRGVPSWLYAGVAAAVLIAGSLFAIGSRGPAQAAARGSVEQADLPSHVAQVAQPVMQPVQNTPVSTPVAQLPVQAPKAPVVDPVLAAALAQPTGAPTPEVLPPNRLAAAPQAPTPKAGPRFASSRGTHVASAPVPVPVAQAPRAIAAPVAAPQPAKEPVEGSHDVRSSQQTSAAASKVIGDSL
ncbi:MAG: hypothetical protein U0174_27570 [Polyangiaceae bacterium]